MFYMRYSTRYKAPPITSLKQLLKLSSKARVNLAGTVARQKLWYSFGVSSVADLTPEQIEEVGVWLNRRIESGDRPLMASVDGWVVLKWWGDPTPEFNPSKLGWKRIAPRPPVQPIAYWVSLVPQSKVPRHRGIMTESFDPAKWLSEWGDYESIQKQWLDIDVQENPKNVTLYDIIKDIIEPMGFSLDFLEQRENSVQIDVSWSGAIDFEWKKAALLMISQGLSGKEGIPSGTISTLPGPYNQLKMKIRTK